MKWQTILPWIVVSVLVTYILTKAGSKTDEPDRELLQQNTALRDSLSALKYREVQAQNQILQKEIDKKDQQIEDLLNRKQQIVTIREKVAPTVNNYTDPELAAALAEYDRTH
jgi:hypothetical protein